MARYKSYNYAQMMMVPVCLKEQLTPGSLEYAINYLVEERLDLKIFDQRFQNDEVGCRAYDPKVLLKVILLSYARGILSSRRMERACQENIVLMALACGQTPDHSTLAAFISSMEKEIADLFSQVLLVCEEEGLLGGTHFSLDGMKLPSNASKEWTGTFKELEYKKEKLEAKVKEAVQEHRRCDGEVEAEVEQKDRREKRIERLTQQSERIEKFLKGKQPKMGLCEKEIRSNVTDPESAYLKTSHGVIQGYNAQALVDSKYQIVMTAVASSDNHDANQISRVLEAARVTAEQAELGSEYYEGKILTADCAYHSERNLKASEQGGLNAYIPDSRFRSRDVRFATQKVRHKGKTPRFTVKDFHYDSELNHYICPNGKRLTLRATRARSGNHLAHRYSASKHKCKDCAYRNGCLQPNANIRHLSIRIPNEGVTASRRMVEKIDTPQGRKIYQRRLSICEPVFANLRVQKALNRFTLRSRKKVDTQWKLFCLVHNIEKIMNFGHSFQNN